jgi:carbon storage regulator
MLILSRNKNESLVIDNDIIVTVVEIRGDKVRLGVICPKEHSVHRQEVYEYIHGSTPAKVRVSPPEEAGFLQAIVANPNDEGLRLVFADWLEERADPLAEFIRLHCALAKLSVEDERRPALEVKERTLWYQHGADWRATLPAVLWTTIPSDGPPRTTP